MPLFPGSSLVPGAARIFRAHLVHPLIRWGRPLACVPAAALHWHCLGPLQGFWKGRVQMLLPGRLEDLRSPMRPLPCSLGVSWFSRLLWG